VNITTAQGATLENYGDCTITLNATISQSTNNANVGFYNAATAVLTVPTGANLDFDNGRSQNSPQGTVQVTGSGNLGFTGNGSLDNWGTFDVLNGGAVGAKWPCQGFIENYGTFVAANGTQIWTLLADLHA